MVAPPDQHFTRMPTLWSTLSKCRATEQWRARTSMVVERVVSGRAFGPADRQSSIPGAPIHPPTCHLEGPRRQTACARRGVQARLFQCDQRTNRRQEPRSTRATLVGCIPSLPSRICSPGGPCKPIELPPRGHTVGASGRGVNLGGGVPGAAGVSYSRCAPAILLKSSVHS